MIEREISAIRFEVRDVTSSNVVDGLTFQYLETEKHSRRRRYLYASANNHGAFMKSIMIKSRVQELGIADR